MAKDIFESSDTVRTAQPLRYAQSVTFDEPLGLESGGALPSVTVAFETYGQLNEAGDNAILICHAISGDSHVARHNAEDDPGWWDILVGPGKPVDTNRFFVICPNLLGGCRGTTGPGSLNPATGKPYGADFPTITIGDMVEIQRRLAGSPWHWPTRRGHRRFRRRTSGIDLGHAASRPVARRGGAGQFAAIDQPGAGV